MPHQVIDELKRSQHKLFILKLSLQSINDFLCISVYYCTHADKSYLRAEFLAEFKGKEYSSNRNDARAVVVTEQQRQLEQH